MVTNDHCPVEATLEIIGGKYKSLILWHLAGGILRFNELQKQLPSATPKMLTQQLRELEAQKLIHREVFPVIPPRVEYSLTELGKSLMPILVAMRDWGSEYLSKKNVKPCCFKEKKTDRTTLTLAGVESAAPACPSHAFTLTDVQLR